MIGTNLKPLEEWVQNPIGNRYGSAFINERKLVMIEKLAKVLTSPINIKDFVGCDYKGVPTNDEKLAKNTIMWSGWNFSFDARDRVVVLTRNGQSLKFYKPDWVEFGDRLQVWTYADLVQNGCELIFNVEL